MILELIREYKGEDCTLGVLRCDSLKLPPIYTLEEPWRNNERRISCVPEGTYDCRPHSGLKFQNVWRLHNVPNRDAILIHQGNTVLDIEGCILVGLEKGTINGRKAVLRSVAAMNTLRSTIGIQNSFTITIR